MYKYVIVIQACHWIHDELQKNSWSENSIPPVAMDYSHLLKMVISMVYPRGRVRLCQRGGESGAKGEGKSIQSQMAWRTRGKYGILHDVTHFHQYIVGISSVVGYFSDIFMESPLVVGT